MLKSCTTQTAKQRWIAIEYKHYAVHATHDELINHSLPTLYGRNSMADTTSMEIVVTYSPYKVSSMYPKQLAETRLESELT